MRLNLLPDLFTVCRLPPDAPIPASLAGAAPVSLSRTSEELSIVCPEELAPPEARRETGWRCLGVQGPIPFSQVGVLASIAGPLAAARVSIFAVSTFDTDLILVPESDLDRAIAALRAAGHEVAAAR